MRFRQHPWYAWGYSRRYRLLGIQRRHNSCKASDPLNILFCGSDEFSIASLRALHSEASRDPGSIVNIDVVCRPDKRVGRGLKAIREVPIAAVAKELSLCLHRVDSFRDGFKLPTYINLIVAVSFGLLVPPRILKGAKYGGLNVHPSILPDFHGAAPLHHTLLNRCPKTGVTLQTLHPKHFDQGTILAQTPQPGYDIPNGANCTIPELLSLQAAKGAEILLQGIRERVFVPPLVGLDKGPQHVGMHRPAPKITPEDRRIDWGIHTAQEIIQRHHVIGPLWNYITHSNEDASLAAAAKRTIWTSGFQMTNLQPNNKMQVGVLVAKPGMSKDASLYVKTCDGYVLRSKRAKVEGFSEQDAFLAISKASSTATLDLEELVAVESMSQLSKDDI